MLNHAARLAVRAAGDVEPNPLVGCVIGRAGEESVEVIGAGHHRRFGGDHAEIDALASCRCAGHDPSGATAWVTLEPCAHHGKTPPCAVALVEAKIAEVVIARRDPHPAARHGARVLRDAGVAVRFSLASARATGLSEPFIKMIRTGMPWIIVKWAQTIDGCIATRTGESKWISNERSRLDAHRLRARVDAIVTGIGTALADDPLLTPRGVRRIRRNAIRIVVDPGLELPPSSRLAQTASRAPVFLWRREDAQGVCAGRAGELERLGVVVQPKRIAYGRIDLRACFLELSSGGVNSALVEGGPGLISDLLEQGLVDELRVYIAPALIGDALAPAAVRGRPAGALREAPRFELVQQRRFGSDALLIYRKPIDDHGADGSGAQSE